MVEMRRVTFKIWKKNDQLVEEYMRRKGLNRSQAINHLLRIAGIRIKEMEWMKEWEIDSLPINESDKDTSDSLHEIFWSERNVR